MDTLERIKPDPVPAIHPVPEYAVDGERARWYAEMKAALQVPWMGVVTMAYAHYPAFFAELWRGLGELSRSRPFVEEATALQALAEDQVATLNPPPLAARLAAMGYGAGEVDSIRDAVEVFSHGNHLYCLIATIARLLMEGGEMTGNGDAGAFPGRHAPDVSVPFVLMEAHHADGATVTVFEDVKAVLGLPFVNTDYRAFARWPSFWRESWGDLRGVAATPAHEAICAAYHAHAAAAAARLPNPGGLTSAGLRAAAAEDADSGEIIAVCRLFQWLLPGLAVNVAYVKAQLAPEAAG